LLERSGAHASIVFISYPRSDIASADVIVGALKARDIDIDVLIDRRDLPYGEQCKPELLDFVRQSDPVVFVVSTQSVGSRWCKWELGGLDLIPQRVGNAGGAQFDGTKAAPTVGSVLVKPRRAWHGQTGS
jgi:hypothetical protein